MPESTFSIRLGLLLKVYRESKKMSLREMASDIGIDFTTLDRLENGQMPGIQNWLIIESWLFGRIK